MISDITDGIDIIICLILYFLRDLLISVSVIIMSFIKPAQENELSKAFMDF